MLNNSNVLYYYMDARMLSMRSYVHAASVLEALR